MRRIIFILLVLVGAGTLACVADVPSSSSMPIRAVDHWVHTVSGWEWTGNWVLEAPHPRNLHPWVVAVLQVLLSAMALLVLGQRKPVPHLHSTDSLDRPPSPKIASEQMG